MSTLSHDRRVFRNIPVDSLTDGMLSLFECSGLNGPEAIYVSTPITTGEALLQWHERQGDPRKGTEAQATEIMQANVDNARSFVSLVRSQYEGSYVIDPSKFRDIPGWEQGQYHTLWCALIERYVRVVVFNAGWYLSNGCVAEFTTAVLSDSILLDSNFGEILPEAGLILITSARERLRMVGLDTSMHTEAEAAIEHFLEERTR